MIYINDPPLSNKLVDMYAYDTSLSFSSNSIYEINEKVKEDLECINTWFAWNTLSLKGAKTNRIVTGSRKKVKDIQQTSAMKPSVVIRDEDILMIEHTKYLGVHVDQYLSCRSDKKDIKGVRYDTLCEAVPPFKHTADHVQKYDWAFPFLLPRLRCL